MYAHAHAHAHTLSDTPFKTEDTHTQARHSHKGVFQMRGGRATSRYLLVSYPLLSTSSVDPKLFNTFVIPLKNRRGSRA